MAERKALLYWPISLRERNAPETDAFISPDLCIVYAFRMGLIALAPAFEAGSVFMQLGEIMNLSSPDIRYCSAYRAEPLQTWLSPSSAKPAIK